MHRLRRPRVRRLPLSGVREAVRSYERSAHFKGIPVWDPSFTVIELATGETLGSFDSEAEVAAALVFAKLSFDRVEVISDANPVARYAGWS